MIVIVGVSMLALLGLGALTVDTGSWFGDGRRVQKISDAGALAGAYQLATAHSGNATSAALANIAQNGGSTAPTCTAPTSSSGAVPGTLDTITVTCDRNSPSFLANLFGITSAHVHETAKVQVFGLNKLAGVVPIAVDQADAKRWASLPSVTLYFHGGGGDEDNGRRFGFLDLSAYGCQSLGTSNTSVVNGLASCIRNGAPNTITAPTDLCRARPQLDESEEDHAPETGDYSTYRQAIDLAVQSRTGQKLYVPVYSSSSGDDDEHESGSHCGGSGGGDDEEEGSRGSYHIVGFAVFLLQSSNFVEHSESEGGDEGDDEKGFVSLTGQFQGIVQGTTTTAGTCLCGANTVSIIQ